MTTCQEETFKGDGYLHCFYFDAEFPVSIKIAFIHVRKHLISILIIIIYQ